MAKPTIKFYAAPYEVNGHKGYRPQLEAQNGVYDLDFCKEVVNEKRLAMSPEELLHALEMTGEIATKKVAEDGRPRGITKLIKWNRFASGSLESPSSPWNASCKASIKPQLLAEATKLIDATFTNVTSGIGVRLNDVTWLGAQSVQNVLKIGADFSANGSHMEFIEGDTAVLKLGEIEYALECKSSDVSHAVFAFPEELEDVEPGTQAMFTMKSRGGVVDGQVYTVKKTVTIIAGAGPVLPKIAKVYSAHLAAEYKANLFADDVDITMNQPLPEGSTATIELVNKETGAVRSSLKIEDSTKLTKVDEKTLRLHFATNTSNAPDGTWELTDNYDYRIAVTTPEGTFYRAITPVISWLR